MGHGRVAVLLFAPSQSHGGNLKVLSWFKGRNPARR